QIAVADRGRVRDLVRAARADAAPPGVDDRRVARRLAAGMRVLYDRHVHALRIDLLDRRLREQILEHGAAALGGLRAALELEVIAAILDADAELLLDLPQVLVELTADFREPAGIRGLENDVLHLLGRSGRFTRRTCASFRQPIGL